MRWLGVLAGAAMLLVGLIGCCCGGTEPVREMTWTVMEYRHGSHNTHVPGMDLVVREEGQGSDVFNFWHGLGGRKLEWGVRYKLAVVQERQALPLGYSKMNWRIKRVLKETKTPGQIFTMHLVNSTVLGADGRSFNDGKAFVCNKKSVCRALDERLRQKKELVNLRMKFGKRVGDPLILLDVQNPRCVHDFHCPLNRDCSSAGACPGL